MITYSDLLATYHAEAIANTLENTELAVHRRVCREYSKTFHTPLHEVLAMDPADVLLAYYEDQLEDFDEGEHVESLLDIIYTLEDPAYEKEKREDLEKFIDDAERQEEERIKAGKPIHKAMKNEPSLENDFQEPPKKIEKRPTRGSIDLSYLSKEEED